MQRQVPALFALGIALLLVANPLFLFPHAGQSAYDHSIEQVEQSEVPAEADVLQYESLSPEAKAAIRDARNGDGVVYGEANRPPEFFYSDYSELNQGLYYVEQDGSYYRLYTYAGGGLFPVDLFAQGAYVVFGLVAGLVAALSRQRDWRRLPAGVGGYGGVLLVAAVPVLDVSSVWLFLGAVAGIVGSLVALGYVAWRN